ncbi:unnamed protein product, partial [Brachionus calyciflorus]
EVMIELKSTDNQEPEYVLVDESHESDSHDF